MNRVFSDNKNYYNIKQDDYNLRNYNSVLKGHAFEKMPQSTHECLSTSKILANKTNIVL